MRKALPVLLMVSFGSCTVAPAPFANVQGGQARLAQMLAGKIAGRPQSCIPSYVASNLEVIDPTTFAYRDGSRIYVNQVQGACHGAQTPGYTLVMHPFGFGGPCQNDVVRVTELSTGMVAGSCILGPFVPYTNAR